MGYDGKHCGEIEMANKIVREIIHGETAAETIYRKAEQFEGILRLSKKEILTNAGSISAKIAEEHALTEFEKYRVKQDKVYQSDFDKILIGEVVDNEIDDTEDNKNNKEEL